MAETACCAPTGPKHYFACCTDCYNILWLWVVLDVAASDVNVLSTSKDTTLVEATCD